MQTENSLSSYEEYTKNTYTAARARRNSIQIKEAGRQAGQPRLIASSPLQCHGPEGPLRREQANYIFAAAGFAAFLCAATGLLRGCAFTMVSSTGVVPCTSAAKFAPAGTR